MLENIVKKIAKGTVGLVLSTSLGGCGTTLYNLDKRTQVWYTCNTNEDYPSEHPCYKIVIKYNFEHKSSSTSPNSSSRSIGGRRGD